MGTKTGIKKATMIAINRGRTYTVRVGTLTVNVKAFTATEAVEEAKEKLGDYPSEIIAIKEAA